MNGPERVRAAIAGDRGWHAPAGPVTLCGQPDGTAVRADAVLHSTHRPTVGERIAGALMCPACLLPRIVPGHRLRGCRP